VSSRAFICRTDRQSDTVTQHCHATNGGNWELTAVHIFLAPSTFSYLQRSCHIHWLMATFKDNSHISCRAPAVPLPCRVPKGLRRVFPIRITQSDRVWFTQAGPCPYRAPTMPRCDFSRPRQRHGMGTTWYVWINIGRLSTACGRSAQVPFLPTTTGSFTTGNSDFCGYTRTFTKDKALSEDGRGTARYVCINTTRHGTARQGICGLAFRNTNR
jgi:hypothetical protein